MSKRPIDKKRDAAFQIRIGSDEDSSPLVDYYTIGNERMLQIKENGIYEVRLPDDIDPERTNFELAPTQNLILSVGASDPVVQRILLTAKVLFRTPGHLGESFDYGVAQRISFEILKQLISLRDAVNEIKDAQNKAWEAYVRQTQGRGALSMPSIPDVESKGKVFFQKSGNLLKSVEELIKLFYPRITSKAFDALGKYAAEQGENFAPLAKLVSENQSFLSTLRNIRNAIEHEKPTQRVSVENFFMNASGEIMAPQFSLVHPETPIERASLAVCLERVATDMVGLCELFLGFLCLSKVQSFAGMPLTVQYVGEETRGIGGSFQYVTQLKGSGTL